MVKDFIKSPSPPSTSIRPNPFSEDSHVQITSQVRNDRNGDPYRYLFYCWHYRPTILGASEFYPPSSNAISYLRDPHNPNMQLAIWPAQVVRGLLFALVLFPYRKRFIEMGAWAGGFTFGAIIFVIGFIAASGGMFEHFVYFNEYPIKFALITSIEILVQAALMGTWIVSWMKRTRSE